MGPDDRPGHGAADGQRREAASGENPRDGPFGTPVARLNRAAPHLISVLAAMTASSRSVLVFDGVR